MALTHIVVLFEITSNFKEVAPVMCYLSCSHDFAVNVDSRFKEYVHWQLLLSVLQKALP